MSSMEVEGEEKRGKRSRLTCLYDDWIVGNSIGRDLLVYIEGWSYPSRKHLQDAFSKFSTSKIGPKPTCRSNRLGKQAKVSLADTQVGLGDFCFWAENGESRLSRQGDSAKPTRRRKFQVKIFQNS
jgi:hypothetical protein